MIILTNISACFAQFTVCVPQLNVYKLIDYIPFVYNIFSFNMSYEEGNPYNINYTNADLHVRSNCRSLLYTGFPQAL